MHSLQFVQQYHMRGILVGTCGPNKAAGSRRYTTMSRRQSEYNSRYKRYRAVDKNRKSMDYLSCIVAELTEYIVFIVPRGARHGNLLHHVPFYI